MDLAKVGTEEFLTELRPIQDKIRHKPNANLTLRERQILMLNNRQQKHELDAELALKIAKLKADYSMTPEQLEQKKIEERRSLERMLPNFQRIGNMIADYLTSVLKNEGNFGYMNAVLYALRFVPTLMHGLHHLFKNVMVVSNEDDTYVGPAQRELLSPTSCVKWHATSELHLNRENWPQSATDQLNGILKAKSNELQLIKALHFVFAELHRYEDHKCRSPFNPEKLTKAINGMKLPFKWGTENDSHSFLMYMLEAIQKVNDDLTKLVANNPTMLENHHDDKIQSLLNFDFIGKYFVGQRIKLEVCMNCMAKNSLKEDVLDFNADGSTSKKNFIRDSCPSEVRLTGVMCRNCKQSTEAKHLTTYPQLPAIMIVRMEYFGKNNENGEHATDLPFEIDCFCDECVYNKANHKYRLVSFISHTEEAADSVRYSTYVRSAENDLSPPPTSKCQHYKCCKSATKKLLKPQPVADPWYVFNDKGEVQRFALTEVQQMLKNQTNETPCTLLLARNDLIPALR